MSTRSLIVRIAKSESGFCIDYGSNFSLSIVNEDKNDWITRNAAKAVV